MKYITNVIPHKSQPYNTVADWRFNSDYTECYINVSDVGDEIYHNALALHEQTEIMLLLQRMTPREAIEIVDSFDKEFEKDRTDDFESEPGDDPDAPYANEHCFATSVERMYIAASGKNYKEYEDKLVDIMRTYES